MPQNNVHYLVFAPVVGPLHSTPLSSIRNSFLSAASSDIKILLTYVTTAIVLQTIGFSAVKKSSIHSSGGGLAGSGSDGDITSSGKHHSISPDHYVSSGVACVDGDDVGLDLSLNGIDGEKIEAEEMDLFPENLSLEEGESDEDDCDVEAVVDDLFTNTAPEISALDRVDSESESSRRRRRTRSADLRYVPHSGEGYGAHHRGGSGTILPEWSDRSVHLSAKLDLDVDCLHATYLPCSSTVGKGGERVVGPEHQSEEDRDGASGVLSRGVQSRGSHDRWRVGESFEGSTSPLSSTQPVQPLSSGTRMPHPSPRVLGAIAIPLVACGPLTVEGRELWVPVCSCDSQLIHCIQSGLDILRQPSIGHGHQASPTCTVIQGSREKLRVTTEGVVECHRYCERHCSITVDSVSGSTAISDWINVPNNNALLRSIVSSTEPSLQDVTVKAYVTGMRRFTLSSRFHIVRGSPCCSSSSTSGAADGEVTCHGIAGLQALVQSLFEQFSDYSLVLKSFDMSCLEPMAAVEENFADPEQVSVNVEYLMRCRRGNEPSPSRLNEEVGGDMSVEKSFPSANCILAAHALLASSRGLSSRSSVGIAEANVVVREAVVAVARALGYQGGSLHAAARYMQFDVRIEEDDEEEDGQEAVDLNGESASSPREMLNCTLRISGLIPALLPSFPALDKHRHPTPEAFSVSHHIISGSSGGVMDGLQAEQDPRAVPALLYSKVLACVAVAVYAKYLTELSSSCSDFITDCCR